MDELRHQATGRMRLTFAEPVDAAHLASVPHVTDAQAEDGDVLLTVDGPVTELLRRAADLGATAIETEHRDLDDIFLEMYQADGSEQ
jgi:hypothetical protein